MNNYVITEIDSAQKKMSAYVSLLSYRYMNLCVNVYLGDQVYNIEDVANVYSPDEFQFSVYPKNENNQQDIIQGIYEAHPEFKMELKTSGGGSYILYTMPEVDENRHDFLQNAIKGLHEECCGRLEAIRVDFKERMMEDLTKIGVSKAEIDEALKALDDLHERTQKMADQQLEQKQAEIDEALAHYEQNKKNEEDDTDFDYSKGMKMYQSESEE